jgi:hypothetical protein
MYISRISFFIFLNGAMIHNEKVYHSSTIFNMIQFTTLYIVAEFGILNPDQLQLSNLPIKLFTKIWSPPCNPYISNIGAFLILCSIRNSTLMKIVIYSVTTWEAMFCWCDITVKCNQNCDVYCIIRSDNMMYIHCNMRHAYIMAPLLQ